MNIITKKDLYYLAADQYLSQPLPDNFFEMSEEERDTFIADNLWEPFENYPVSNVKEFILFCAKDIGDTLYSKGIVVEKLTDLYESIDIHISRSVGDRDSAAFVIDVD